MRAPTEIVARTATASVEHFSLGVVAKPRFPVDAAQDDADTEGDTGVDSARQ